MYCLLLCHVSGWEKNSYGYHGDDGHSFCSSGTGKPYGPTFTTGDVIGCGVNLIDNTCFYTKNGVNLGNDTFVLKSHFSADWLVALVSTSTCSCFI